MRRKLTAVAGISVETTQKGNQAGRKVTVQDLC